MTIAQGLTTDEIKEGLDNQYFTVTRAQDAVASLFATVGNAGINTSNVTFTYNPTSKTLTANVKLNPTGILSLSEDLTPSLGGNLNLSNYNLSGTGNISGINLYANYIRSNDIDFKSITGSDIFVSNNIAVTGNVSINGAVSATTLTTQYTDTNEILVNNLTVNGDILSDGKLVLKQKTVGEALATFYSAVGTDDSWLCINTSRGTVDTPEKVLCGDLLSGVVIYAHNGTDYIESTIFGGAVDTEHASINSSIVPGSFFVATQSGIVNSVPGDLIKMTFNSMGVLQAPIIQTGTHSTFPKYAKPGMIIFNETDNHFYGWNGKTWRQLDNE
jgi:hypothetical protein